MQKKEDLDCLKGKLVTANTNANSASWEMAQVGVVAVDENQGDELTVAMMTITITTIKVTAELERIRCALQSRDDEVEALRREVGELIETFKDDEPPPPFDLRP